MAIRRSVGMLHCPPSLERVSLSPIWEFPFLDTYVKFHYVAMVSIWILRLWRLIMGPSVPRVHGCCNQPPILRPVAPCYVNRTELRADLYIDRAGPMMQACLRDSDVVKNWEWRPGSVASLFRSQEFYDATIQSAAVYSLASFSLPVTFLIDTNILFYANMCVLSPLMVRGNALCIIDVRTSLMPPSPRASPFLLPLSTRVAVRTTVRASRISRTQGSRKADTT